MYINISFISQFESIFVYMNVRVLFQYELYTWKKSLCCCLLCDRVVHPHSLYMFHNDTDLVHPLQPRQRILALYVAQWRSL